MKRILLCAGARPNLPKIAALLHAFKGRAETILVHTGQHYDDALSGIFFRDLELPSPDFQLAVGSGSHAWQTAEIMLRFEPVLFETKPDIVIVVGDVNSTLACALVAQKGGFPVAHVEAGLRSFDRSMPEEINRTLTDHLSDWCFASEPSAIENLRREGIPCARIYYVGNVMVDMLLRFLPKARSRPALYHPPYTVLTLHRPSNVDNPTQLSRIAEGIFPLSRRMPIVFPAHPRTQAALKNFPQFPAIIIPPLGYLDFVRLLDKASIVLTDSGGIQEEATVLGIPCLTLRDSTERPITVTQGTNRVVGTDLGRIRDEIKRALSIKGPAGSIPALWDGRSAERIAEILFHENHRA